MPPALCYIGYITNGCMTEAMQIRDIPKLVSIIEEHTFTSRGAHCTGKGKPGDTEAMVLLRMVCLSESGLERGSSEGENVCIQMTTPNT